MDYLAHTPPKDKPELAPHLYADHVSEVLDYGLSLLNYLLGAAKLSDMDKEHLSQTFKAALMLHDMGKLDESNQCVFRGEVQGRLPVDHLEAGAAVAAEIGNELLGWLIRGHHAPGLPSKKTEKYFIRQLRKKFNLPLTPFCLRGARHNREKLSADWDKHHAAIAVTDKSIQQYKERQIQSCGSWPQLSLKLPQSNLTTRIMLSCLVDSDHGSAACYSQNIPMTRFSPAETRWEKRLKALDKYISGVVASSSAPDNERNRLRGKFYRYCSEVELFDSHLAACSAPVGLGKTTSVMAYLLRCAIQDGVSRIFVIAPFSNIIDQTVNVLRKSIVISGENPETVVVAHHHKADFSSKEMRQYTASWQAPVVVTTAVQFFETLASSNPSQLRKLHNVVGSALFIDESHACLPPELLRLSWYWIKQLAHTWNCHVIFSSGSMVRFWQDDYLVNRPVSSLPNIYPAFLQKETARAETQRIVFEKIENPMQRYDLVERITSDETWNEYLGHDKPSCLVILNTVQSAALIAETLAVQLSDKENELSSKAVLHLSTALAPKDRDRMLNEVIRRQTAENEWNQKPWYLVATSCVEAGVDLDFAVGFRESCSVTSLLQVSGRINRHGKRPCGKLYDFSIVAEDGLNCHPGLEESSDILRELWPEIVKDEANYNSLCSLAIRKELSRFPKKEDKSKKLLSEEEKQGFQEVSRDYRIIDSDTATVIIDRSLVEKLKMGIPVGWQTIQKHSVQLWTNKINKLQLGEIRGCRQDGIYSWIDSYDYDPKFLGIMSGILQQELFFQAAGGVF
jgi:CRISPR/Cas system-associated endonuclease/helicase Cas3